MNQVQDEKEDKQSPHKKIRGLNLNQDPKIKGSTWLPEFLKWASLARPRIQRLARENPEEGPGVPPVVAWALQQQPGPGPPGTALLLHRATAPRFLALSEPRQGEDAMSTTPLPTCTFLSAPKLGVLLSG